MKRWWVPYINLIFKTSSLKYEHQSPSGSNSLYFQSFTLNIKQYFTILKSSVTLKFSPIIISVSIMTAVQINDEIKNSIAIALLFILFINYYSSNDVENFKNIQFTGLNT